MLKKLIRFIFLTSFWLVVLCIIILFGSFLYTEYGSEFSRPINSTVYSYEDKITEEAEKNGIEEFIPLLEAMMMQESGGHGNDPMQSSESEYNELYPVVAGGITDPEYSIEVGVKYFAKCLEVAEVLTVYDYDNIYLALQGYNFGYGYILWAQENYDEYSMENVYEFQEIQKENLNTTVYGDSLYVKHVLRYYKENVFELWKSEYNESIS